ncbi:LacI family DNA-binding transcriptional regulator [Paracoccus laeviglucosivorans]|uniref:Transcriptional regulator, LacI family n=1 Tax=Paracoccus laeviglucosivorans TaxID=1197861 RepID=A0A521ED17_9RHOB|nr:LacI family DNA-binding transcriptional regulator [Paracoccus laeviglucosivorans]SMO81712.1 transcriptional regulator, LacI family [Paracoccus laeviglucosivorans]
MPQEARPPRIQDVAKLAGVSVATVSRVLSNPAIVSAATREAVRDAIRQTGYTVNFTARNLRQQQVGSVLALVPKLANPFFSQILSGIAEVLRKQGLSLLVLDTHGATDQPDLQAIAPYLNRSRSDGVIVLEGGLDPALFARPGCPPVVQACEWSEGLDAPRVLVDNAEGGRLAAAHLTGLGHRDILHLAGPRDNTLSQSRRVGFLEGLKAAGLSDTRRIEGDFSMRAGHEAAKAVMAMSRRPTAIFCDSDEIAVGLINGLVAGGLRVPDDISVMGFDDIELAAYVMPPLTTIRQHRAPLGRRAAEVLLARMQQKQHDDSTVLPVELVVRGSTAAPAR